MPIDKMFGEEGMINVCFDEKCEEFESLCQSALGSFVRYFQKKVEETLKNVQSQTP